MLLNRLKTLIKEDPLREEIDLSNQAIYVLDSNSVDLLSRFKNLKILNLSDNYISKLPLTLDLLKNLHSIDLNGNPISEIETAVDALKQVGPNLISLQINLFEEDQVDYLLRNLSHLEILNGLRVERDALFNDEDDEDEDENEDGIYGQSNNGNINQDSDHEDNSQIDQDILDRILVQPNQLGQQMIEQGHTKSGLNMQHQSQEQIINVEKNARNQEHQNDALEYENFERKKSAHFGCVQDQSFDARANKIFTDQEYSAALAGKDTQCQIKVDDFQNRKIVLESLNQSTRIIEDLSTGNNKSSALACQYLQKQEESDANSLSNLDKPHMQFHSQNLDFQGEPRSANLTSSPTIFVAGGLSQRIMEMIDSREQYANSQLLIQQKEPDFQSSELTSQAGTKKHLQSENFVHKYEKNNSNSKNKDLDNLSDKKTIFENNYTNFYEINNQYQNQQANEIYEQPQVNKYSEPDIVGIPTSQNNFKYSPVLQNRNRQVCKSSNRSKEKNMNMKSNPNHIDSVLDTSIRNFNNEPINHNSKAQRLPSAESSLAHQSFEAQQRKSMKADSNERKHQKSQIQDYAKLTITHSNKMRQRHHSNASGQTSGKRNLSSNIFQDTSLKNDKLKTISINALQETYDIEELNKKRMIETQFENDFKKQNQENRTSYEQAPQQVEDITTPSQQQVNNMQIVNQIGAQFELGTLDFTFDNFVDKIVEGVEQLKELDMEEKELSSTDLEQIAIVYDKIRQIYKHFIIYKFLQEYIQLNHISASQYLEDFVLQNAADIASDEDQRLAQEFDEYLTHIMGSLNQALDEIFQQEKLCIDAIQRGGLQLQKQTAILKIKLSLVQLCQGKLNEFVHAAASHPENIHFRKFIHALNSVLSNLDKFQQQINQKLLEIINHQLFYITEQSKIKSFEIKQFDNSCLQNEQIQELQTQSELKDIEIRELKLKLDLKDSENEKLRKMHFYSNFNTVLDPQYQEQKQNQSMIVSSDGNRRQNSMDQQAQNCLVGGQPGNKRYSSRVTSNGAASTTNVSSVHQTRRHPNFNYDQNNQQKGVQLGKANNYAKESNFNNVKILPMNQLKEIINDIFQQKMKFDGKCFDSKLPQETLEQFMYTYLNLKYGLKSLIIEQATTIITGLKTYVRDDHDVTLFAKILKNECDEQFRFVQIHVKETLANYLKQVIRERHPAKSEAEIYKATEQVQSAWIEEWQWKKIILRIYRNEDAQILIQRFNYIIESHQNIEKSYKIKNLDTIDGDNQIHIFAHKKQKNKQFLTQKKNQNPNQKKRSVSKSSKGQKIRKEYKNNQAKHNGRLVYHQEFMKTILDFQLQEHERFLNEFNILFREVDTDLNGIIDDEEFKKLIMSMNIVVQNPNDADNDIDSLLKVIDPHNNRQMTYSQVVQLLSSQLVPFNQDNINQNFISSEEDIQQVNQQYPSMIYQPIYVNQFGNQLTSQNVNDQFSQIQRNEIEQGTPNANYFNEVFNQNRQGGNNPARKLVPILEKFFNYNQLIRNKNQNINILNYDDLNINNNHNNEIHELHAYNKIYEEEDNENRKNIYMIPNNQLSPQSSSRNVNFLVGENTTQVGTTDQFFINHRQKNSQNVYNQLSTQYQSTENQNQNDEENRDSFNRNNSSQQQQYYFKETSVIDIQTDPQLSLDYNNKYIRNQVHMR